MSNPVGLGGLFAQGMPKLRPTGNTSLVSSRDSGHNNNGISGNNNDTDRLNARSTSSSFPSSQPLSQKSVSGSQFSVKTSLEQQLSSNRSGNLKSPEKKSPIHYPAPSSINSINSNPKFNTISSSRLTKPNSNDLSPGETHNKGRAPSVPTSSSSNPPLPAKPPGVNRSLSQSSGQRPGLRSQRPAPPSTKPPPPPKANDKQMGVCFECL